MNKEELINALSDEFKKEDMLPYIEKSKYIETTRTLKCKAIELGFDDLGNLKYFIKQLKNNLKEAGKRDYQKLQSAYYAELAELCVDYVIQEKMKEENIQD